MLKHAENVCPQHSNHIRMFHMFYIRRTDPLHIRYVDDLHSLTGSCEKSRLRPQIGTWGFYTEV